MPHYTHTHFINKDFLLNHTPTEFHFSCDSLQSVFSAYNSSVITLQMLTLDLCQSAGTVRKPTVLKRPWPQKHERGEGGVNTCEWEIGRPRERERERERERTEWLKKTGRERVGKQSGWPMSVSPWTAWHPRGGRLLQPACDQSWQMLGQMGLSCRLRVCVGAKKRGGAPGRAVLKPAGNSSGTC